MKYQWKAGSTDRTILVFIQDSSATDGSGLAGVTYSMLTARYIRVETDNDVTITSITMSALSALTDAHADGGWIAVDATNAPGWYRFDIPDGALAAGAWSVGISLIDAGSNNIAQVTIEIQLISVDFEDAADLGVTALTGHTPQTGDSYARLGAPAGASVSADIAVIDGNVDSVLEDTGTTLPATLATIDGIVDDILVDTGTSLPSTLSTISGKVDTVDSVVDDNAIYIAALIAAVNIVDANVDAILNDTGTSGVIVGSFSGPALLDINAQVDSALDTAIPGSPTANSINDRIKRLDTYYTVARAGYLDELAAANLPTDVAAVKSDTAAILTDTGTTLDGKIDTIDGIVDAILADTGTDGVIVASHTTAAKAELQAECDDALTAFGVSTVTTAQVNAEVDTALADINLDHLIKNAVDTDLATTVDINSVLGYIFEAGVAWTYNRVTDSLESLRDRGDAAWVTGGDATAANQASIESKIDTLDTVADAILVDTGTTLPATLASASDLATVDANVDAILLDTGTDGVVITAATMNSIADALLKRDVDQVEASAPVHSLATATLKAVSKITISGSDLIVYQTDGSTPAATQAITTDNTLEAIKTLGVAT